MYFWHVRKDTYDWAGDASRLNKIYAALNRACGEFALNITAVLRIMSMEAPTELHQVMQNSSV